MSAAVSRVGSTVLILAALAAPGCGRGTTGPPEIVVDRTACDHCRMLVSDVRYAAAFQAPAAEAKVFDDIGCLLAAVQKERGEHLAMWFRDADDGQWIPGAQAIFVSTPVIRTPMSGGVVAYRDRAAAERAAAHNDGTIVGSVAELLESRKAGS